MTKRGIRCHLVRTPTVPTGDPDSRAGRSRLFPSVFDASIITFEMVEEADATPARGWGPMITIESAQSAGKEVIHGWSVEFVMRDYPTLAPDRVAIHRAGARLDAAGTLFVEFPAGTGLQMATFLHTFVHLPGALPARVRPDSEALAAPPRNASEGGGISIEFYGVDYTYVRSAGRGSGPRRPQSQTIDGLVHVVATGDPIARTASLAIRRESDRATVTTLDLKGAQVTVAPGRANHMAVLLTLRAVDSTGAACSFQRHLHSVSSGFGPRAGELATAISSAAICASASTADAPSMMPIDQGAGASAGGGGGPSPPPPTAADDEATRASLALIEAPPPEGKRHLAIIGRGYKPQFDTAIRNAPNVGLNVVHLQSASGFAAIVPRLVGLAPTGVVEYVLIVDDPELHPIRLMPAANPRDIRAREEATDGLVASVSGATSLLLPLPGSPTVCIYVWEELDRTKSDPSVAVSEKLSRLYVNSPNVHVLSQFPADADGNASAQTIAVRAQWRSNLRSYRPFPETGQRKDIPRGWTPQALGMMVQSMFGGATARLALRRQQELDSRRFDVPVTAIIRGTGPAPSIAEQRDATHYYLFTRPPDHAFEVARHQIHPTDARASALVETAVAYQPPAGVLRGYAATTSPATDDLSAILVPPDGPIAIADFGRTRYAAVLAVTAAFASAATGMASKPRFNLQFVLNDVTSVLQIAKDDVPTFRLSLAHAAACRGQPRLLLRHDPPQPPGRVLRSPGDLRERRGEDRGPRRRRCYPTRLRYRVTRRPSGPRFGQRDSVPKHQDQLRWHHRRAPCRALAPGARGPSQHAGHLLRPTGGASSPHQTPSRTTWLTRKRMTPTSWPEPPWWRRSSPPARGRTRRTRRGNGPLRARSTMCWWPSPSPASLLRSSGSPLPPTTPSRV